MSDSKFDRLVDRFQKAEMPQDEIVRRLEDLIELTKKLVENTTPRRPGRPRKDANRG